jgi:hypothetical protein
MLIAGNRETGPAESEACCGYDVDFDLRLMSCGQIPMELGWKMANGVWIIMDGFWREDVSIMIHGWTFSIYDLFSTGSFLAHIYRYFS